MHLKPRLSGDDRRPLGPTDADVDRPGITAHSPKGVEDILDRHYLIRTRRQAERAFRLRLTDEGKS